MFRSQDIKYVLGQGKYRNARNQKFHYQKIIIVDFKILDGRSTKKVWWTSEKMLMRSINPLQPRLTAKWGGIMVKQCRFDGDLKLLLIIQGTVRIFRNSNQTETAVMNQGSNMKWNHRIKKKGPKQGRRNVGKPFYLRLREMVFCWLMGVP